jgi:hypothetical protein
VRSKPESVVPPWQQAMLTKLGAREAGLCEVCCSWNKTKQKCRAMDHGQGKLLCLRKWEEENKDEDKETEGTSIPSGI